MQHAVIKQISEETMANLLADSTPTTSLDTGPVLVSTVIHPRCGVLTIISNMCDATGIVLVDPQFAGLIAE